MKTNSKFFKSVFAISCGLIVCGSLASCNKEDNDFFTPVDKGDNRELMAGGGNKTPNGKKSFRQTFVLDAPVSLLMVIDFEKFGRYDEKAVQMGCVDAGNVSENINLYCQSAGLATVPRATHDTEGIRSLLGLTEKHLPIMNNPVGFEKK